MSLKNIQWENKFDMCFILGTIKWYYCMLYPNIWEEPYTRRSAGCIDPRILETYLDCFVPFETNPLETRASDPIEWGEACLMRVKIAVKKKKESSKCKSLEITSSRWAWKHGVIQAPRMRWEWENKGHWRPGLRSSLLNRLQHTFQVYSVPPHLSPGHRQHKDGHVLCWDLGGKFMIPSLHEWQGAPFLLKHYPIRIPGTYPIFPLLRDVTKKPGSRSLLWKIFPR